MSTNILSKIVTWMFGVNIVLVWNYEISFISRLDCTFYNKFRLVYIIILIKRGKLGSAKQEKEVIIKKGLVSLELFVKYLWWWKGNFMWVKKVHDSETDSKWSILKLYFSRMDFL